jgi:hypothetical protein
MFWTTRRGGLDLVGASFLWIYEAQKRASTLPMGAEWV